MPFLKYTLFVGASLLAIIVVADYVATPAPAGSAKQSASLDMLRQMANHGASKQVASAASAGPFLAMPVVEAVPVPAVAEAPAPAKPAPAKSAPVASVTPPAALNAQARLAEVDVSDRPARPAKKVAHRKPKPRIVVVENTPRAAPGFFAAFQSW